MAVEASESELEAAVEVVSRTGESIAGRLIRQRNAAWEENKRLREWIRDLEKQLQHARLASRVVTEHNAAQAG